MQFANGFVTGGEPVETRALGGDQRLEYSRTFPVDTYGFRLVLAYGDNDCCICTIFSVCVVTLLDG